ncbi:uncharacterized protein LOC117327070 [Pecten maximus]|uniref:uncharacterized protein LOC117327070 n=1 Tax=Pecten maximus TaxID=6579 RepID=UPI0014581B66|nr:uncharacterized protein LOC117327070 [Pecten maximus]
MFAVRSLYRQVGGGFRRGLECTTTVRSQINGALMSDGCTSPMGVGRKGRLIVRPRQLCTFNVNDKELLRPRNAYTVFSQQRYKSKKRKNKQTEESSENDNDDDGEISDEENSDDESDDNSDNDVKSDREKPFPDVHFLGDDNLSSNYKMLKRTLSQPRYDSVCRFGLRMSSKTFLNDLSEQRCKLNGLPLKLKRTKVNVGDSLDVIADDNKMRRIRVVSLTTSPKNTIVCIKVWRAPFLRSLVKEYE